MLHYILYNTKSRHLLLSALLCTTTYTFSCEASRIPTDEDEAITQERGKSFRETLRRGALFILNEEDAHPSPQKSSEQPANQLALRSSFQFPDISGLFNNLVAHIPSVQSVRNNLPSVQDTLLFILNEEKEAKSTTSDKTGSKKDPIDEQDDVVADDEENKEVSKDGHEVISGDARKLESPSEQQPSSSLPADELPNGSTPITLQDQVDVAVDDEENKEVSKDGQDDISGDARELETPSEQQPSSSLHADEPLDEEEDKSPADTKNANNPESSNDRPDIEKEPDLGDAKQRENKQSDSIEEESSSASGEDEGVASDSGEDEESNSSSGEDEDSDSSSGEDEGSDSSSGEDEGSDSSSGEAEDSVSGSGEIEEKTPPQSPYSTPKKTRANIIPKTPEALGYKAKTTTPTHGDIYHGLQYTYKNPQGREVTLGGGRLSYILGNSPHPKKFKLVSASSPQSDGKSFHQRFNDQDKKSKK